MNTGFEAEEVNSHLLIGKPLIFEQSSLSGESFDALILIFKTILQKLGREDLWEPLTYVINEMVANADKANIKRFYFKEKCLDIHHPEEYQKGMKLFSQIDDASRESLRDKLADGGFKHGFRFSWKTVPLSSPQFPHQANPRQKSEYP